MRLTVIPGSVDLTVDTYRQKQDRQSFDRIARRQPRLTKVHDVVPADRTVVYDNVPSPERYGIPLISDRKR